MWHTLQVIRARALFYTLLIAGICYSSSGQQAESPKGQITASEILRKNLIATGGLEAHKALESLVATGDFHVGSTNRMGDYKFSYKAPSNDMLQIDMISHGTAWKVTVETNLSFGRLQGAQA
jgi:hypothetical protein